MAEAEEEQEGRQGVGGGEPAGPGRGLLRIPPGLRYMAAAAFFFSVMSLLVKVAGQRLPTQEVVLARSLVGALLSWAVLRARGVSPLGHRRGLLLVRALLGYGALSCFFHALVHLPLAEATVIQYTNPVFTALLAAILLSERLRIREVVLVLVSLAGVVLMTRPGFIFGGLQERLDIAAAAIALLGAVLSAGAYVTVRKLGASEDPLVIVFWFAALSTLGAIPFTALKPVLPTALEWLALAGIGAPLHTWYGVRVFTDTAADDAVLPDDLDAVLAVEDRAGRARPRKGEMTLSFAWWPISPTARGVLTILSGCNETLAEAPSLPPPTATACLQCAGSHRGRASGAARRPRRRRPCPFRPVASRPGPTDARGRGPPARRPISRSRCTAVAFQQKIASDRIYRLALRLG